MSQKNKKDKSPINVLMIGSGGREHALGWKLKQSKRCGKVYFAPGNAGTSEVGVNTHLNVDKIDTKTVDEIAFFCRDNGISLVVIGPEDPLAAGLADKLTKSAKTINQKNGEPLELNIFGPVAEGARLEADKAYAKELMRAASVPTAEARIFTSPEPALEFVRHHETPLVVKAAGLAKGKGVTVCDGPEDAEEAVKTMMMDKVFAEAGNTLVIEERLVGQEVSVLALVDGQNIFVLDPAQDHKQAHEGDKGPNTGGMGSYSPTPLINDDLMGTIEAEVLVPIVDAMRRSEVDFKGVLYAGLMLTAGGPKTLEFNVRFGDPETQALMMRLNGDLVDIMLATCQGTLHEVDIQWSKRYCCCTVMASEGYPGSYEKGRKITGIEAAEAIKPGDVKVFHAGTKLLKDGDDEAVVTAGGRVLNVCAMGDTLKEAQELANAACDKINFNGGWFRRDIGYRVMN